MASTPFGAICVIAWVVTAPVFDLFHATLSSFIVTHSSPPVNMFPPASATSCVVLSERGILTPSSRPWANVGSIAGFVSAAMPFFVVTFPPK